LPKFLSTSDLDATSLKNSLKDFLKAQDRFKDYDYEGSNMSALLDVLVQNTAYGNHYLNMVGAEGFLDSADLRESIVSRAKELNYVPRSRVSSRSIVNVEVTPTGTPASITIPKGYRFGATANNTSMNFITNQNYVITPSNGSYYIEGVEIFEGELVTEVFDVSVSVQSGITLYNNRFVLQSDNIDTSSIEVYVQADSSSPLVKYELRQSLFGLKTSSTIFFIRGYSANQYEIEFGDGHFGVGLVTGNIVTVKYRDTIGSEGNGVSVFDRSSAIEGYSNISVSGGVPATGGLEREPNDSIKFNAVRHFQTQERAVTEDDYKNLIITNFPDIEAVSVFGGESRKQFGKVIISVKPTGTAGIISDSLKNRIASFLNLKSLTTEPVLVDADYFYLQVNADVRYLVNQTTLNENEIKAKIVNNLMLLNTTTYSDFGRNVYTSRVSATIDSSDPAILSNSTFIKLIKKIYPAANTRTQFAIEFGNQIETQGVEFEYPKGYDAVITSGTFQYKLDDIIYDAWIQDNGKETLYISTYDNDGNVVSLGSCGKVNYTTGRVDIDITVRTAPNGIRVFAKTESRDIDIVDNKFVILEAENFNIKMLAKNA
jgi:hypothetical protein